MRVIKWVIIFIGVFFLTACTKVQVGELESRNYEIEFSVSELPYVMTLNSGIIYTDYQTFITWYNGKLSGYGQSYAEEKQALIDYFSGYDETFFETKALVIVDSIETSSMVQVEVYKVYLKLDEIIVVFRRTIPDDLDTINTDHQFVIEIDQPNDDIIGVDVRK